MISAIVPAAGRSRRMGTAKQLLPLGDSTVLGHVVDQLLRSSVGDLCVVVGHEAERIAAALAGRAVRIVPNPDYRQGDMLSSIRCGLRATAENCEAVLVALGDQPGITAELVDRLIDAFRTSGKGIVVPVCAGRRGHPLLFARGYCQEVLSRHDEVGLRGLLAAHADDVGQVSVCDPAVLCDIDNPEDYLRQRLRRW